MIAALILITRSIARHSAVEVDIAVEVDSALDSARRAATGPLGCSRLRGEVGAGSVLALTVIAAILAMGSLVAPLGIVLVTRERLAGAADAAALAAADVIVGLRPGDACSVAREAALANVATLTACVVDGEVVTVRVTARVINFEVIADATAGPAASRNPAISRSQPPSEVRLLDHASRARKADSTRH